MAHSRKLVLSGVALVKARIAAKENAAAANLVRDDLEQTLIEVGYFEQAPFQWVGLIIRYGLKDETEPHYEPISEKHGDLPLAIEVDANRLVAARQTDMELVYKRAALIALIHAGDRYGLPVKQLQLLQTELAER
jgi:hypothetical protein